MKVSRFKLQGDRCGVLYVVTDEDQWYRLSDVRRVLDSRCGSIEPDDSELREFNLGDGDETFLSSFGLASMVDKAVGEDRITMRGLWITGWYEDLTYYAETGTAFKGVFAGAFSDDILEFADGVATSAVETALSDQKSRIYQATSKLHDANDSIEDALTFMNGFSAGIDVIRSEAVPGNPLYTPCDDLTDATCAIEEAIDRLYRIANGGGDDDK